MATNTPGVFEIIHKNSFVTRIRCPEPLKKSRRIENICNRRPTEKTIEIAPFSNIGKIKLIIILFLSFLFAATSVSANTLSQKRGQLKKARHKLRALRKHIRIANVREKDLACQLSRAQNRIIRLRKDIKYLNSNIKLSRSEIQKIRKELGELRTSHGKRQAILQKRLKEIYLHGDVTLMGVVAGSSSFSDFLNQSDYLSRIVDADEQLIKSIRIEQEAIKFKQGQINDKYRRMLSYRGRLKQKSTSLEAIKEKREELLDEVEEKRKSYLLEKYELEDHTHELEMEIQKRIREYQRRQRALARRSRKSGGGRRYAYRHGTGSMSWPTGGPITSDFGWRIHPIFGRRRLHTGIDIGAGYGQSIRAADSGTVIFSGWCGGYGNAVIIDHGRGISTLYAHSSRLYVRKGQAVSKGQSVAAVGSTGYSTGPHLHFEVRVNGVPVSPWGYLR